MSTDKTLADVQPGGCVQLADSERARFEAWAKSKGVSLYRGLPVDQNDTGYGHVETQRMWEAWQAAASVINCGDAEAADDYRSAFQDTEHARYLVDAAGIHALESFLTVAEEFRLSAQPYIEAINESGNAGDDEISEVFDGYLNHAKGAISRSSALSAQPSPGGQGDAVEHAKNLDLLRAGYHVDAKPREAALNAAIAALAARQPVEFERSIPTRRRESAVELLLELGFVWNNQRWEDRRQPVREPVAFAVESKAFEAHAASRKLNLCQHPLHYLFLDRVTDEARQAWKAALAFAPPAQAVDLPYSLDADPAGIRARVADVITGTLMVGAQGHTPPPAGHWAEPFWQAARADAVAQAVDLGPFRSLARSWIVEAGGTVADTKHACADELLALIDSQDSSNG
ncbi:TPA: hypothetical protein ACGCHH_000299 [Stenotrophomonas maltophilia]